MGRKLRLLAAALVALAGGGCASSEMSIDVFSETKTNEGRPFHVVVRTVPTSEFASETYESIAAMPYAKPVDESILVADYVFPGVEKEIVIDKPDRYPVAVYFLLTKPGSRWKTQFALPLEDSAEIYLSEWQIQQIND
ncbi:MAG: hypothetical protein ACYS22_10700 [Planctomycetota bacterium]|jgi:hypothetical protein